MVLTLLRQTGAALPAAPSVTPAPPAAPDASWLPRRIKLLRWGSNPSMVGDVRVGRVSLELFSANARQFGCETVPLDFEHSTALGSPEYNRTREPRPVAGYGRPRVVAGNGIWLEDIEWKPPGVAKAWQYEDLSPAVLMDAQGEVVFMHSVALVRAGAVFGLGFPGGLRPTGVCLSEVADWSRLSATGSDLLRLAPALPVSHPSL